MLGLLTSDFGYQNRLTLLQQLIECGDVLLGRELVYGTFLLFVDDVIRCLAAIYRDNHARSLHLSLIFIYHFKWSLLYDKL